MKLKLLFLSAIILFLSAVSCKKFGEEAIDPLVLSANPDWTTASHGKTGKIDYAFMFPQDKVNTLEITLGKATWEAVKTDMVAKSKGIYHEQDE